MLNITKTKSNNNLKFAKDIALIGWLIILLAVGILAAQGKASRIIIGLNLNLMSFFNLQNLSNQESLSNPKAFESELPSQILQSYLSRTYARDDQELIPPMQIVLDRVQLGLTWRNSEKIDDNNGTLGKPTKEDYESYFAAVVNRLESIAAYSSIDSTKILKINNDFVPPIFRESRFQEQEIDLPPEAVTWVRQKQLAALKRNQQLSLLDTFILLIILGGFGSWIYLVRLHLDPKSLDPRNEVELRGYIYRPMLGMALALAVFIVDVSLHSVVSTAQVEQIRRETLIILAFAAGLLSEKAYLYVEKIAGGKLEAQEKALEAQKLEQQAGIERPESGHIKSQLLSNGPLPEHNETIEIEPLSPANKGSRLPISEQGSITEVQAYSTQPSSLPEIPSSGDDIQIGGKDGSPSIKGANERIKELKDLLEESVESTRNDLKL